LSTTFDLVNTNSHYITSCNAGVLYDNLLTYLFADVVDGRQRRVISNV